MARLISLPTLIASLVVLGVARACWYYVYLENPYDYYHRYCAVGCAGMDQADENFGQCCLPLTSGQETPAVCSSLSDKCAAEGTTCEWGREVPTTDQPATSAPPESYTPPAYTPPGTTDNAAMPTASTEVVWVTETTTTPCATTSPPPPVSSPEPEEEPCVCPPEGETSMAAAPTETSGEGALPPDGYQPESFNSVTAHMARSLRRGWKKRGAEECVCPTSGQAAAPTTSAPPPPPPPPPPAPSPEPEECVCPPEGETSMAAAPTETSGEGALPPDDYSPEAFNSVTARMARSLRRGYRRTNGADYVCPPRPPPPNDCVCPTPGETSMAAAPTESSGEGALPPVGFSAAESFKPLASRALDLHRGYRRTTGEECVCPTAAPAPTPTETSGEGNTPPAIKRNTPPANLITARAELNGREAPPVVTVTSTSIVTTDDCVPTPTETAGEGNTPPGAKRRFARWSDF
ncbi:hypothetical protein IAT40_002129 [Kwoniella sp. CBS 6097]